MRSRLHKAVKPKPDEAEQVITVVEDVKGMRPQAYAIRSRLFMACYPCLHFHEVNSKEVWDGDHSALPVEIRLALNNSEKETA